MQLKTKVKRYVRMQNVENSCGLMPFYHHHMTRFDVEKSGHPKA